MVFKHYSYIELYQVQVSALFILLHLNSPKGAVNVPEERSPQMAQRRFWESVGPGLWPKSGFRPNGGFTSSELLTACRPDMDTVELIWRGIKTID